MGVLAHRRPDQYYWVTALTSGRDRAAEPVACLLMAGLMTLLATLPVVLLFTPVGPQGPVGVTVTLVVAAWALAMAAMWGRRRWPTRAQSKVFFVSIVVGTAVNTLMIVNPMAALLGSVAFAVLGFYVVFFHSTGYLAFNVIVALGVTLEVAHRLSDELGILAALCGFVFVTLVNLAAPVLCWMMLKFVGVDIINPDVDLFTGCATRAAFVGRVGELTGARARDGDNYLVFTVVVLEDLALLAATEPRAYTERAQVSIAQTVQRWTRNSAVVAHLGDGLFAVADIFTNSDLEAYSNRILGALSTTPPRMCLSIGIVRTPLTGLADRGPEDVVDDLVGVATTAAHNAPARGERTKLSVVSRPESPSTDA